MDVRERLRILFAVRDALNASYSEADTDIVLDAHGLSGYAASGGWGEPAVPLGDFLQSTATDTQLEELATYLGLPEVAGINSSAPEDSRPGEPEALFLFASHLSDHRQFLGEVERELEHYGVVLFVAHDSIPMGAPWSAEIANALRRCHGGVTFIHPDFSKSAYCQQEVGWMLGRGIDIARLMFGETPVALLSELQGVPLLNRTPPDVADRILTWAVGLPTLGRYLATSTSQALVGSASFNRTDRLWAKLVAIRSAGTPLSVGQCECLLEAAESNDQVYNARNPLSGQSYRLDIADLVDSVLGSAARPSHTVRIGRLRDPQLSAKFIQTQE